MAKDDNGHYATPDKALQKIGRVVAVFRIMKSEARVRELWTKSNKRMYNMFQGVDRFVEINSLKRVKATDSDMKKDWAASYERFIKTEVEAIGQQSRRVDEEVRDRSKERSRSGPRR